MYPKVYASLKRVSPKYRAPNFANYLISMLLRPSHHATRELFFCSRQCFCDKLSPTDTFPTLLYAHLHWWYLSTGSSENNIPLILSPEIRRPHPSVKCALRPLISHETRRTQCHWLSSSAVCSGLNGDHARKSREGKSFSVYSCDALQMWDPSAPSRFPGSGPAFHG